MKILDVTLSEIVRLIKLINVTLNYDYFIEPRFVESWRTSC